MVEARTERAAGYPVTTPDTTRRGASGTACCQRSLADFESSRDTSAPQSYDSSVDKPIVFRPTERNEANLAILEAAGLSGEAAIRAAITSLAVECTPVAWRS